MNHNFCWCGENLNSFGDCEEEVRIRGKVKTKQVSSESELEKETKKILEEISQKAAETAEAIKRVDILKPSSESELKSLLPTDSQERKKIPIGTGVLDYFPAALAEVAKVSWQGNEQHNPGEPLHWARNKSADHYDTMMRHALERGTRDVDGQRHSAKMVWRCLAILEMELEAEGAPIARGAKE